MADTWAASGTSFSKLTPTVRTAMPTCAYQHKRRTQRQEEYGLTLHLFTLYTRSHIGRQQ